MTPLMTLDDAAKVLAISSCTLRRKVARGEVPHKRIGGAIRFSEQDLNEYLERCQVGTRGAPEPKLRIGPLKWIKLA
jgi:excisionase family DNA binding protein